MVKRIMLYTILFTFALLAGCGSNDHVDNSDGDKVLDNNDDNEMSFEEIIDPNNKLGFDLINKVERDENNNIFISPTSALFALAIAYNGAAGETKEEIARVLHVHDLTLEDMNMANDSLMKMLEKDSEAVKLSIANSIWLNEDYHFTDEFSQNTTNYLQAEATKIDVNDVASVEKINKWVSRSTNEKIETIVDAPLDPSMVAMLINALYFKGTWTNEFDKENTENLPFYQTGTEKEVSMMMLEEELLYMENDDFQAVTLPYGKGEMSMQVFLPSEQTNIDAFLEDFTEENWRDWNLNFQEREGTIKLPKFQIEYETKLNETLQQLGMKLAFDGEGADFSNMIEGDNSLSIHEVKQKTYIDVDEEGTEAAAVTSVEIRETSIVVDEDEPFYMEVNRPFVITIKDEETGAILFMGVIENPLAE